MQASSLSWHPAAYGVSRAPTAVGLPAWARAPLPASAPAAHAAAGVAAASGCSTTRCVMYDSPCKDPGWCSSRARDDGMMWQVCKQTVALHSCSLSHSQPQPIPQSSQVTDAAVANSCMADILYMALIHCWCHHQGQCRRSHKGGLGWQVSLLGQLVFRHESVFPGPCQKSGQDTLVCKRLSQEPDVRAVAKLANQPLRVQWHLHKTQNPCGPPLLACDMNGQKAGGRCSTPVVFAAPETSRRPLVPLLSN